MRHASVSLARLALTHRCLLSSSSLPISKSRMATSVLSRSERRLSISSCMALTVDECCFWRTMNLFWECQHKMMMAGQAASPSTRPCPPRDV